MHITTVGDWSLNPLGNAGQWCKIQLRFVLPERRWSWGIYIPTPPQSWLRAAPGGVNSTLLSPQEGKKH